MRCVVCGQEEVDGKYEEYGLCPICSSILDDVITISFKKLEKSDSDNLSDYFEKELEYLEELASWMWGWVIERNMEAAKGADERYFKRMEKVVNWMKANPETLKKISDRFFCKCESCGADLTAVSTEIEESHWWFRVRCKNCGNLIAKCFLPKEV